MTIVARGLGLDVDVIGALVSSGLTIKPLVQVPSTGLLPFCLGPMTDHLEMVLTGTKTLRPFVGGYAGEASTRHGR